MGMYTEFVFAVELYTEAIEQDGVIDILKYMVRDIDDEPKNLPDHPFFKAERWKYLFTMNSSYFPGQTHSDLTCQHGYTYLTVRSNLKNYDSEIQLFLDWIIPYIVYARGECFGYFRYEEYDDPWLIYINNLAIYSPVMIRKFTDSRACEFVPLVEFLPDKWHEWKREKEVEEC